jgi:glycosyltransferase involved in cell wall biosynthesis
MKLLICSNVPFQKDYSGSGNWISSFVEALHPHFFSNDNSIVLMTLGETANYIQNYKDNVDIVTIDRSYHYPYKKPGKKLVKQFKIQMERMNPDIVHVWGTEGPWCYLLEEYKYDKNKIILSIQGVVNSLRSVWFAGLSFREIIKIGLSIPDLYFLKKHYFLYYYRFNKYSSFERAFIIDLKYVVYQSNWVKAWINAMNTFDKPQELFRTNRNVRTNFKKSFWSLNGTSKGAKRIVTISSSSKAYKGLHVLIKAFGLLVNSYKLDLRLSIIGVDDFIKKPFYLRNGYERFIYTLLIKYDIIDSVDFLGKQDSNQMVESLCESSVFVQSSFVESYSLTLAEALCLGLPSVVSYSAALPELGGDKGCLYYPAGDYVALAQSVYRVFENEEISIKLSEEGRKEILTKTEDNQIVLDYLKIYNKINTDEGS